MSKVNIMIQHVQWVNTQYSMLSPTEKTEFDAKLAEITRQPKNQSQRQLANLGGNTEYNNETEDQEPEYIKQLKEPRPEPKKVWLNNRAE